MSDGSHTRREEAEGRHSRRTFVAHAAPAVAAAAAAVGIAVAVDDDAPERARVMIPERTRLTILPGSGLVYNVRHYGAQGDGQTDDGAAIQRAINAAIAAPGTVYFPAGTYMVQNPLVWSQKWGGGVSFIGDGCARGAGSAANKHYPPSRLLYKGTTGSLLRLHSVSSWLLANLGFWYEPGFTGDLIDVDGVLSDCQGWTITYCSSKSMGAFTARSIVRLNKAIYGSIERCGITGSAGNGIRVGDPGGHYVNAVQIEKCTFNHNLDAHILIGTNDGENVTIRDCGFEAGTNITAIRGATVARDGKGHALYSPLIEGCWAGDNTKAPIWIDSLYIAGSSYPGTIRSCLFGNARQTGKHLILDGPWTVEGCSFQGGTVYSAHGGGAGGSHPYESLRLTALGNNYAPSKDAEGNEFLNIFDPHGFPAAHPWPTNYVSLGNHSPIPSQNDSHGQNFSSVQPAAANRITALHT